MMFTSNEIRLLRDSRQMKQEDVARKMGIKKQRYSQLENHKELNPERTSEILKVLLAVSLILFFSNLTWLFPSMTSHMQRQVVALSEGSIAVRTLIRTYT